MSKLQQGQLYRVENLATRAWRWMRLLEVYEYRGHEIAYGELGHYSTYLPATTGHQNLGARPGSGVVLSAPYLDAAGFCDAIGGRPLAIGGFGAGSREVLVNMQRVPGWWDGDCYAGHDHLVRHSRRVIDLWGQYQSLGRLPVDFAALLRGVPPPEAEGLVTVQ